MNISPIVINNYNQNKEYKTSFGELKVPYSQEIFKNIKNLRNETNLRVNWSLGIMGERKLGEINGNVFAIVECGKAGSKGEQTAKKFLQAFYPKKPITEITTEEAEKAKTDYNNSIKHYSNKMFELI